ncbi:alpha-amylase family glycosyl hydrolase [Fodinibius salsisoli]|uniref:Alpha-glucosidase C-terminal domain-containing protein n=1 Tax=Fodinibius salsisoli TaxID=2820877 RepID=A0ABT3PN07_9BACT|nr:alpha-amylase family glycosyl hydrolase [Fodinibius salsisoli]MCW9707158.1 alpha-glucosidase C-terminal domain-containing protein [Fodinibius salsisoli]
MKEIIPSLLQRPLHISGYLKCFIMAGMVFSLCACGTNIDDPSTGASQVSVDHTDHPAWSKSANIYEVNIRQYTPEGTFNAFRKELPRLKEMGVDILWLMPIHPIGEEKRKGELGSYYSIKNYTAVNPHFGTMDDFKALVDEAQQKEMKVFMDWVPNHTAWDHPWIEEYPEYYMQDSLGNITYEADWTDIAQLNYANKELWDKMIERMKFWITEANIDGYRVDHAGHDIPLAFWKKAIPAVNKEKEDFFWLAEWNTPEMHPWFDATYTWEYFHLTTAIASGEESLSAITEYMAKQDSLYPEHAYRLYFTTNHDENSWNGSDQELFGDNFKNFAVMAATIDGMPLVYSGQETGLNERLEFFKKDTIRWDGYEYEAFYKQLFKLKDQHAALWNGQYGGDFEVLPTAHEQVYAYKRTKGEGTVIVVLNFATESKQVALESSLPAGTYQDAFMPDHTLDLPSTDLQLPANGYIVLVKQ